MENILLAILVLLAYFGGMLGWGLFMTEKRPWREETTKSKIALIFLLAYYPVIVPVAYSLYLFVLIRSKITGKGPEYIKEE